MSDPAIRPARPQDAELLSGIALRAKAHWGYGEQQMRVFAGELTFAPQDLARRTAFVREDAAAAVGFYTLVPCADGCELEHIFVDPPHIGHGHGRALFDHACAQARSQGHARLVIQSDPNAAGFYDALGCDKVRDIPSSIPGRTIPLYHLDLRP